MNTNTGAIREFDSTETIPRNHVVLTKPVAGILAKFSRKERKHLWATYQILELHGKIGFSDFVETLFKAYNYEKGFSS